MNGWILEFFQENCNGIVQIDGQGFFSPKGNSSWRWKIRYCHGSPRSPATQAYFNTPNDGFNEAVRRCSTTSLPSGLHSLLLRPVCRHAARSNGSATWDGVASAYPAKKSHTRPLPTRSMETAFPRLHQSISTNGLRNAIISSPTSVICLVPRWI